MNAVAAARARPKARRLISPDDWRILRALSLYRLMLALLLLVLFETGYAPRFFEQVQGRLFETGGLVYLAVAALLWIPLTLRWPPISAQAYLQFAADAACVTTLIWSSAGMPSGLGMLLITPIFGCSLILSARLSLLLGAGAVLVLLGEEIARIYYLPGGNASFTATGILGSVFLITAFATNAVAERVRRSEAFAARVGSDLASVTRLNERIVEQMLAGAIVVDDSHRIRLINAAARRLLNLPSGGAAQRLDEAAPRLAADFVNWLHGRAPTTEPFAPAPNAEEVLVRFSSLGSDPNAPTLILLDEAREARARAQQLKLAALGRLSASIAHEIRNPLAAISNAGQLLAETSERPAEDQRLLGMIQRHSERINRIVNDILTLSRGESSGPDVLQMPAWLERAVAQYREGSTAAAAREIRIENATAPFDALFDPHHLQQILTNLWDNAFQHGGERVAVTVRCLRIGPTRRPCLDVEDNGGGIRTDMVEQIFEPFFTTAHQGTGLGLYLARELSEYNQATLSYVPRREPGACFRLAMMEVRPTR